MLRAFRRCAVIYNAQDLFPDAYLASQEVRAGWLARAMSGLMTRIYRASDRITVITGSFAEAIAARGIDRAKVVTIPNFVDTAAVTPLPRANSFRRRHALDDRYVVMYAGNIGYTHGTELLVDAAAKLAAIPDLLFLVIGGGSKQADLVRLARERRLANMQFLPTQPRELLPEMLATADVFVLTSKPGVGKTSFPGRIYNFLLAARPVVASVDENSDLAQVLAQRGRRHRHRAGERGGFLPGPHRPFTMMPPCVNAWGGVEQNSWRVTIPRRPWWSSTKRYLKGLAAR